jgi:hypothetical protein
MRRPGYLRGWDGLAAIRPAISIWPTGIASSKATSPASIMPAKGVTPPPLIPEDPNKIIARQREIQEQSSYFDLLKTIQQQRAEAAKAAIQNIR